MESGKLPQNNLILHIISMSYIRRSIDTVFAEWVRAPSRKPLLLRGARQVGKTRSVRELKSQFSSLLEINFLENKRACSVFTSDDLSPVRICRELGALYSEEIIDGRTLLFLDEVQVCPQAIEALRFFYEQRPNLHVVAAGSLLEFALEDLSSFGVGRIQSVYMRPITFREFLNAMGMNQLIAEIERANSKAPLPEVLHAQALSLLKDYLLLGGLPEVIAAYLERKDFTEPGRILSLLRDGYEDDFTKYKGKVPQARLSDTLRAVAQQTGKKFIYRHAYVDAVSAQVHQALHLLEMAGLVIRVRHTAANGIPLGAEVDTARFKAMLFDIGLYQKLLGLSPRELIGRDVDAFIHRGSLCEAFVGMELLGIEPAFSRGELWYWHRESRNSNAEVDYLLQIGTHIVPVEVKANTRGSMTSLQIFMKEKKAKLGLRISAENFGRCDNFLIVPLYATNEIGRLVRQELDQ